MYRQTIELYRAGYLVAGLDSLLTDADGQVGFANPGWSDAGSRTLYRALVHREAGLAPVHVDPPLVAPLLLMGDQGLSAGLSVGYLVR